MSRGITEQDVWQAADALLLEGARPTIERVRQKIGRGSPNTVGPYLDSWFRRLGPRLHGTAVSQSQLASAPVQQAAQQFWEIALASARAELEEAFRQRRDSLEADREQLEQERAHMQAAAERLAARQQGLEEALAATRAQLGQAAQERERLAEQVQAREAEAAALRAESSAARDLAQQLALQLENQRLAHEAERQRLEERAASHEKRWTLELDRTREALKQLQSRMAAAEAENARRTAELGRERDRLDDELRQSQVASMRLAHDAESWKQQCQQTRQLLDQAEQEARQRSREQTDQLQRLLSQLDEARARLDAREVEHAAVLRSLAEAGLRRKTRRRDASAG